MGTNLKIRINRHGSAIRNLSKENAKDIEIKDFQLRFFFF